MAYEYKWYIIRVNYGCERNIRALVNGDYFKEVFIPYKDVRSGVCEMYVYMHLCDTSVDILNAAPGFCGDSFEVILEDEVNARRKEFAKYKWYILRVASNYEEKVRQHMLENSVRLGVSDYFKEVFIPYEEPSKMESRSKKTVIRRKCFPGYVFLYVNLCDEVLNFINNIPKSLKVYGFLKDGSVPKVISDDEIHSMCGALYNVQEDRKLHCGFEKGEKVRIIDGLFQNFTGKVETIDDEKLNVVSVEVFILGKPTVIELDITHIEKVEE